MFCSVWVGGGMGFTAMYFSPAPPQTVGSFGSQMRKNKTSNHTAWQNWHVQLSSYSSQLLYSKPNYWSPHPWVSKENCTLRTYLRWNQRWVQLKALTGTGGALPPCWPSAAAGAPSEASVPTLTPCTSYCGKAAERNQPKEQLQHGPLAWEGC